MSEYELDGVPMQVECPVCEGTGIEKQTYWYDTESGDKIGIKWKCSVCDGEGRIDDVPVYGIIDTAP